MPDAPMPPTTGLSCLVRMLANASALASGMSSGIWAWVDGRSGAAGIVVVALASTLDSLDSLGVFEAGRAGASWASSIGADALGVGAAVAELVGEGAGVAVGVAS